MKPILIDALHICMGGGLMILNHLVNNLVADGMRFVLLKDIRCPRLESEDKVIEMVILSSAPRKRRMFYKSHRNDFSKVLCFGNIPPQIRLDVPVITYLHNVSLLKIPADYSLKAKILSNIKKRYIKYYSKNTDVWVVQTSNTANLVAANLAKAAQPILQFPFYRIPNDICRTDKQDRKDYVFIGDYTNAKGHEYLVDAWTKLSESGFNSTLHLTVSNPDFIQYINRAINEGAHIINHGFVPFEEVIKIYNLSKATVYPSLNESLGLGIIEAVEAGCDVIGADLPYMHSVCKASILFKPCDADSIAEAVIDYEKSRHPSTTLRIKDTVSEFISFIKNLPKSIQ